MLPRTAIAILIVGLARSLGVSATPPEPADADLERRFTDTVRPFLDTYCVTCHGGANPPAQFDPHAYASAEAVTQDHARWALVLGAAARRSDNRSAVA